jgi:acetyl esterase/lipase
MSARPASRIACLAATFVLVLVLGPAAALARPTANTGRAASPCRAIAYQGPVGAADGGYDTTSLGPGAPAAYELGAPTSAPERDAPVRRLMLLVHGGGWYTVGPEAVRTMRAAADQWRAAGWSTAAIGYRACGDSARDVVRFYDVLRARVGPDVPICAQGGSAGAHLALVLASVRPLACAIATGAPTDLTALRRQGAREAALGAGPAQIRRGSAWIGGLARAAFGPRRLARYSPARKAAQIVARVLLASVADDTLVPWSQATRLAGALRRSHPDAYVDVARLEKGSIPWVHGAISETASDDLEARIGTLVAPFGRAPSSASSAPATAPAEPFRLFGLLPIPWLRGG